MKKLSYCKGIAIAHGKSEYDLARYIKSNLHLPIEIYAEHNGKTSIQINSLMNVLNNSIFGIKTRFKNEYIIEEDKGKFLNFKIMPIMDLDDANDKQIKDYISGEMFKKHWLSPYILPIWNDKNLDEVLFKLKLIDKMPTDNEKGKVYGRLFPINKGGTDKEQIELLMKKFETCKKTNMDKFVKKCLDSLETKK